MHRRWIPFVEILVRKEDTRLPKPVMFGEVVEGAISAREGRKRSEWSAFWTTAEVSGSRHTSERLQHKILMTWHNTVKPGEENTTKCITAKRARVALRHALVYPNVTEKTVLLGPLN